MCTVVNFAATLPQKWAAITRAHLFCNRRINMTFTTKRGIGNYLKRYQICHQHKLTFLTEYNQINTRYVYKFVCILGQPLLALCYQHLLSVMQFSWHSQMHRRPSPSARYLSLLFRYKWSIVTLFSGCHVYPFAGHVDTRPSAHRLYLSISSISIHSHIRFHETTVINGHVPAIHSAQNCSGPVLQIA